MKKSSHVFRNFHSFSQLLRYNTKTKSNIKQFGLRSIICTEFVSFGDTFVKTRALLLSLRSIKEKKNGHSH